LRELDIVDVNWEGGSSFIPVLEAIPQSHTSSFKTNKGIHLPGRQNPVFHANSKERRMGGWKTQRTLLPSAFHNPISSIKITDIYL
jgi:hypothetical protein